jgi:hypothetical protein
LEVGGEKSKRKRVEALGKRFEARGGKAQGWRLEAGGKRLKRKRIEERGSRTEVESHR